MKTSRDPSWLHLLFLCTYTSQLSQAFAPIPSYGFESVFFYATPELEVETFNASVIPIEKDIDLREDRPRFVPWPADDGSFNITDVPGFENETEYTWDERYQEATEYYKEYGHTRIPQEYPLGIWVSMQRFLIRNRKDKKTPRISDERFEKLQRIRFKMRTRMTWENKFDDCVAYHKAYGHFRVPDDEIGGLGNWMHRQRFLHYNATLGIGPSRLSPIRIECLNRIDFPWMYKGQDTPWWGRFQELKEYKKKHGNTLVPAKSHNGLGYWVRTQRKEYRKYDRIWEEEGCRLSDEQVDALKEIGFVWDQLEMQWMDRYDELIEFRAQHGNTMIPSGSGLDKWVRKQRHEYRKRNDGLDSQMTQRRINQLNAIGFEWAPFELQWMTRYQELIQFKKQYGHTGVPVGVGGGLGLWVRTQRLEHRKLQEGKSAMLTPERRKLLNDIGFEWKAVDSRWNVRYMDLVAYYEKHGDTLVPFTTPGLGPWVSSQRIQYRKHLRGAKSYMTPERIEQLNLVDFVWEPLENQQQKQKQQSA